LTAKHLILISPYNPHDVLKWSGTIYSIYAALRKGAKQHGFTVDYMSCGQLDFAARVLNKVLNKCGLPLDCRFSTAYAMVAGALLTIRLLFVKEATLVAVAASNCVSYLKTKHAIIYISDGTFRTVCELYPAFRAFPKWLQAQGDKNEAIALAKAQAVIYPSRWASQSAQRHYGVEAERIHEIPFGPNIPSELMEERYSKPPIANGVTIIFVSADWVRKNGDMTLEVCRLLAAETGIAVRLILIGDAPDYVTRHDFVEKKGFLRKSDAVQLGRLCQAYREAHFLLLPTKADASPIVFSEAQAFGVPPVTYDVGGTSSAILDGETGLLLPPSAGARELAQEIQRYVQNPQLYQRLSERCRQRYLEHANWGQWSSLIFRLAAAPERKS
jgi:glycosyltransferase involved in cell wall biosynthesis